MCEYMLRVHVHTCVHAHVVTAGHFGCCPLLKGKHWMYVLVCLHRQIRATVHEWSQEKTSGVGLHLPPCLKQNPFVDV